MKLSAMHLCRGPVLPVLALMLLLSVVGCSAGAGLTISTAASLGDAMEEIAVEFEQIQGVEVDVNLGASNVLARQVELGAPVDVVFLAGQEPMDDLVEEGFVSQADIVIVLRNSLAVVSRAQNGKATTLSDLASLASDYSGRISIADPQLAPAGMYANAALQASGIAADLKGRIIPTLDVRAAAVAVESGNAEFGIVYSTDALAFDGIASVLTIPADLHPPIVYPAAVVSGSGSEQLARQFLLFLQGEFAASVFRSHGFITSIPDER